MTKMTGHGDFDNAIAIDVPKVKTRDERLVDWKQQNKTAYDSAVLSCSHCAPSRAEMLLVNQYEGSGPSDL